MKKNLFFLIAFSSLVLALAASGCSGGSSSDDSATPTGYNKSTADPNKPASPSNAANQKPMTPQ